MSADSLWRLRIRELDAEGSPGLVRGAGFAVTPKDALTCAHLSFDSECWVDVLEWQQPAQRCVATRPHGDPGDDIKATDVAVISLRRPLQTAPLGPRTPPVRGAELEIVGFPFGYPDLAERTRVRVTGTVTSGLIQVDPLPGHSPVVEGYSGSAAMDVRSGRVVGMMVGAATVATSAWLIPLAEIAKSCPQLDLLLPERLDVDPEFRRAVDELNQGAYAYALARLNGIRGNYPGDPDIAYYRVLAALQGRRPGALSRPAVDEILALLAQALSGAPRAAHVAALLALAWEDFYFLRGLERNRYDLRVPEGMPPWRAAEIVKHVHAPECMMWRDLNIRSMA
jgi:hypothetical protein